MSPVFTGSTSITNWSPNDLDAGTEWRSFEQFRLGGPAALEEITPGSVATIRVKSSTFRVLRDADFQHLIGLASEVHRLKRGITFVVQAAKVCAKHPDDPDSIELFYRSASLLSESNLLPEQDGHGSFKITADEAERYGEDDDLREIRASDIPRPKL
jgi:hypothetical protein